MKMWCPMCGGTGRPSMNQQLVTQNFTICPGCNGTGMQDHGEQSYYAMPSPTTVRMEALEARVAELERLVKETANG